MYKLHNKFDVNFQNDDVYLYLFRSTWNKKVIDKGLIHDYRGFDKTIQTTDGWIVNTANYTPAQDFAKHLDKQLQHLLNTKVETNFVSLLPESNAGRHWDYYSDTKCNTSIVWKVYGNVEVHADKNVASVNNDYALILNTDLLHDAYNYTKQVQWIATSLVYNITYDEVIEIFSKVGMTFF